MTRIATLFADAVAAVTQHYSNDNNINNNDNDNDSNKRLQHIYVLLYLLA